MNSATECHDIEGFPNLYIDAFRGQYLRKTTNSNNKFILTHYHGDHYGNLPRDGKYFGPAVIHCTPITGKLLNRIHQIPSKYIQEHDYGETFTIRQQEQAKPLPSSSSSSSSGRRQRRRRQARVTFYDANHCPGACIVLIQLVEEDDDDDDSSSKNNGTYDIITTHLHTGDMRYHEKMKDYPLLREVVQNRTLDLVYLDTTYGSHSKHNFIPQQEAIEEIASQSVQLLLCHNNTSNETSIPPASMDQKKQKSRISNHNDDDNVETTNNTVPKSLPLPTSTTTKQSSTLILLSCYSIGKERVLWEVSRRTNQLINVSEKKMKMLECLIPDDDNNNTNNGNRGGGTNDNDDESLSVSSSALNILHRCTLDPTQSDIHVIPMGLAGEMWPFFRPNYQKCADYVLKHNLQDRYDQVVAFIPTGWAHGSNWNKKNAISRKTVQYIHNNNNNNNQGVSKTAVTATTTTTNKEDVTTTHSDEMTTTNKGNSSIDVEIRLISYSEHSSFSELTNFVEFLHPRKVIPTVFSNDADRRKMERHFFHLLDNNRIKQAFFQSMMTQQQQQQQQQQHKKTKAQRRVMTIAENDQHHDEEQDLQSVAQTTVPSTKQREVAVSTKKRKQTEYPSDGTLKKSSSSSDGLASLQKTTPMSNGGFTPSSCSIKEDDDEVDDDGVEVVAVVSPLVSSSSSHLQNHPKEHSDSDGGTSSSVDTLVAMGFCVKAVQEALGMCEGDLQGAIDILLSSGSKSNTRGTRTIGGSSNSFIKHSPSTPSKSPASARPSNTLKGGGLLISSKTKTNSKEKAKKKDSSSQSSSPTITSFFSVVKRS